MVTINGKKIYTAQYIKRIRTEERTKYIKKLNGIMNQLYTELLGGNNDLTVAINLIESELRNI